MTLSVRHWRRASGVQVLVAVCANVHGLQFDWGATVLIALINFRSSQALPCAALIGRCFLGHVGPVYLFQLFMHLNQLSRWALILSD